jgi:hypothetical protein
MLNLLGATMVVGSGVVVVGGSAILFALVRVAGGAGGLARAGSFPPPGVAGHAAEVRNRMRSRYMLRGLRPDPLGDPATSIYTTFEVGAADSIAVLIADSATMPITKLPRLNESLRRGLAARAPRDTEPAEQATPRRRRRARRQRMQVRARSAPRS